MEEIEGFVVREVIAASSRSKVYRGVREKDGEPVVLKALSSPAPSREDLGRFLFSYNITRDLDIAGVIRPIALIEHQRRPVQVFEDLGGVSLRILAEERELSMSDMLTIFIRVASVLDSLHRQFVIHKDIKPSNIFVVPETLEVQLGDFEFASRQVAETVQARPGLMEGTLAYIAPEQTGRMNRAVDYRSDLYSLGVSMYEVMVGVLPFNAQDPLTMIHSHIATAPPEPRLKQPDFPLQLSKIISRLMAKSPEERYQSAGGLAHDLTLCLEQWTQLGNIELFPLGNADLSPRFRISGKLYGREGEQQTLLQTFELARQGRARMLLIGGFSGVGKTALVHELHKPIIATKGNFIEGKQDLLSNVPYGSLIQAFTQLVKGLLVESKEDIDEWAKKVLAAVGEQGQLIIDVIPELKALIGAQPPVPLLPPLQANNRFQHIFTRFVGAFLSPEHPLLLFLDDLQWADSSSLQLLKVWLTDTATRSLLIVGAYRENEVSSLHPLTELVRELKEQDNSPLHELSLQPLHLASVRQLLSDTLFRQTDDVIELADLLYQKTRGNPFFIERLLSSLYESKLLAINPQTRRWEWDLEAIVAMDISEDVAQLMVEELGGLSVQTQAALKVAACVGNTFEVRWIAELLGQSIGEVVDALWPAVQDQLVFPKGEDYRWATLLSSATFHKESGASAAIEYRFAHDRVQEGAYHLLKEEEKPSLHEQVGELILKHHDPEQDPDKLFDIVNQLNRGLAPQDEGNSARKERLAQLNLSAGQRASEASAWEAAYNYLKMGQSLSGDRWQSAPDFQYTLLNAFAESALMTGHYEHCASLEEEILSHVDSIEKRSSVFRMRLARAALTSQHELATQTALEVTALFGFDIPQTEEGWQAALGAEFTAMAAALEGKEVASLVDAPQIEDPEVLLELALMVDVAPVSMVMPHFFPIAVTRFARIGVEKGASPETTVGYAYYASLLSILGHFEQADAFGQLALALNDKLQAFSVRAPIDHMYGSFVASYKHPFSVGAEHCRLSIIEGLEHGIFNSGSWGAMNEYGLHFHGGMELHKLLPRLDQLIDVSLHTFKYQDIGHFLLGLKHVQLGLMGRVAEKETLNTVMTEQESRDSLAHYAMALGWMDSVAACRAFILGRFQELIDGAEEALSHLMSVPCSFYMPEFRFFYTLSMLLVSRNRPEEWEKHKETIEANIQMFEGWAQSCPENYKAKLLLLKAERLTFEEERSMELMENYDLAIEDAQANELLHIEAITLELAARYYLRMSQKRMARGYLYDARFAYVRWGALAKADLLENEFSMLQPHRQSGIRLSSSSSSSVVMDLNTVQEAAVTISREIVLEDLLVKLMDILLKIAGAQRGFLFLERGGELRLEAKLDLEDRQEQPQVMHSQPLSEVPIATSIVHFVDRTRERVLLGHADKDDQFSADPYIIKHKPKSVLCIPLLNQSKLVGVLYLENRITSEAFTLSQCATLEILGAQAAVSIENAFFYNDLESKVEERTQELLQTLDQLEKKHMQLQSTQAQLVQAEKMASLGTLVAGVAHELNNPANFNLSGARNLQRRITGLRSFLFELIGEEEADVLKMFEDKFTPIFSNVNAVITGAERIKTIVQDLRVFSRLDEAEHKRADVVDGLRVTLSLIETNTHQNMEIESELDSTLEIECWPAQLNQMFMNIILNAHQAILDKKATSEEPFKGKLVVTLTQNDQWSSFAFKDNGCGMDAKTQGRVCEPFFTTRPVGEGTGLGMATVLGVVQKHKGRLVIESELGAGTTVIVRLPRPDLEEVLPQPFTVELTQPL